MNASCTLLLEEGGYGPLPLVNLNTPLASYDLRNENECPSFPGIDPGHLEMI